MTAPSPLRVLIAVTHLLGVGHLSRAAAIARALAADGMAVTLISGGRPAPLIRLDGVALVQLPPLHITGTAFADLLAADGTPASEALMAERQTLLVQTVQGLKPNVVLTELFPFGRRMLAGEMMALVEAAHHLSPRPAILSSIRDILVAPAKPERIAEAHRRIATLYDGVLVHGDPALVPLDASWPVDADLNRFLHDTGYVDETEGQSAPAAAVGLPEGEVLVSGGGGEAARPVLEAAIGAAALDPSLRWRGLVGAGLDLDALRATAPTNLVIEPARPDFPALLARCAVSVSRSGYNTVLDLARAGCRSGLVPFEAGKETEQRMRAERFAARGLAAIVLEADLSPRTLLAAVREARSRPAPPAAAFNRSGLATTCALVRRFAGARPRR